MAMTGGYPPEANIDDYLADRGIELIPLGTANFTGEYKQSTWGLLNAVDWAGALGAYCPSPTTFNVRGGSYLFAGEVKTYAPGDAVDPTDNDTTYIWLEPDNTISSGVDGDGWPTTEHIKLAEIDVDSDGVITAVRDLRGRAFFEYRNDVTFFDKVVCFDNEVVCYDNNVVTV